MQSTSQSPSTCTLQFTGSTLPCTTLRFMLWKDFRACKPHSLWIKLNRKFFSWSTPKLTKAKPAKHAQHGCSAPAASVCTPNCHCTTVVANTSYCSSFWFFQIGNLSGLISNSEDTSFPLPFLKQSLSISECQIWGFRWTKNYSLLIPTSGKEKQK